MDSSDLTLLGIWACTIIPILAGLVIWGSKMVSRVEVIGAILEKHLSISETALVKLDQLITDVAVNKTDIKTLKDRVGN